MAPRWWLAIVGIVGLLAGFVAFASPGLTALILLMFIAGWAIVIGALEIWGAIQLRKEIEGEWWLILSGLLSIAFGVLLIARPGSGALALVSALRAGLAQGLSAVKPQGHIAACRRREA